MAGEGCGRGELWQPGEESWGMKATSLAVLHASLGPVPSPNNRVSPETRSNQPGRSRRSPGGRPAARQP